MALLYLTAVVLLTEVSISSATLVQPLNVYIDGDKGNDSLECLNSSSSETPCQSLSFISENLTQKYFVHIEILGDILNLMRAVNFIEYSHLNIGGSESNTTLYCNETDAGLAFLNVKNLVIYSLSVMNCGALRNITNVQNQSALRLSVAIYVLNCTKISIISVDISSSNGTGLSLYDTNGEVDIINCNFTNNRISDVKGFGGGGLYIEFTICTPGFTGTHCKGHGSLNSNSRYNIENCNFINNSAFSLQHVKFIPPSQQVSVPRLGKGGGLYIGIGSNAKRNTFLVKYCTFIKNQATYDGGGMIAEFLNSAEQNNVIVFQTHFRENTCIKAQFSGAGGLTVAFMFYRNAIIDEKYPQNNTFECQFCLFQRNQGHMGGGTAIYATKGGNQSSLSIIQFSNCNWTENESAMGAAVFITPGIWDYTKEGYLPIPKFTDCRFMSNSAIQTLKPPVAEGIGVTIESVGYGAVFVSQLHVIFGSSSNFTNNSGSAIHLSNSVINFQGKCSITFHNNTSQNGGAIAMYGFSMLQIGNSSSFSFTNNRAENKGGAIYSDFNAATHPAYHNCFISPGEYPPVNSTLSFKGNNASASGDSIFTTTFQSCELLCSTMKDSLGPGDILSCIANFNFNDSKDTNLSLSTRPEKFELSERLPVPLIPGSEYSLNLSATDEAGNSLHDVVYAASIASHNETVSIDPAFQQVSNNRIMVLGKNGSTAKLNFFTSDLLVIVNITLTECQPGYHHNDLSFKCECAASEYLGLVGCDPNVYLKKGYWMGYCSESRSEFCTGFCPYGFCSYSEIEPAAHYLKLKKDSKLLDPDICGPSRTNRLCGECSHNHSMYYNSRRFTCGSEELCHLGWLFYILSNILPLTIVFFVILVLNISFTTGNGHCFVIYGQLLGFLVFYDNDVLHFSPVAKWIQIVVTFPYDFLNLHFFALEDISFCLWKGSTFMGLMMMNYVTVGFALALVLLAIFVTRYQCVRTKILFRFKNSISVMIHGLSAFFILCYSQAARTTFHILNSTCLYSANFKCTVSAVDRAGHLTYFEGEHVPYAVVAILVLIFMIIIPPLLLLVYPLMFKLFGLCYLSETKLVTILWRMMPIQFLDAFQSSFKDKYRFFAGLYFLYCAAILALNAGCQSWLEFYSSVQLLLITILTIHSVFQPHKERKHNVVDSLLFANLSLINAITLYNHARLLVFGQLKSEVLISALAVVQAVLIILPLLLAIVFCIIEWKMTKMKKKDYEVLPSLRKND